MTADDPRPAGEACDCGLADGGPLRCVHATTVGEVLSFTAKLAIARAKKGLLTEKEIRDALDDAYRAGQQAAQTPGTVA